MAEDAFDELMAAIDPPLIVVTTAADDVRAGCLVGFHSQSSISPGNYCLWLSKANHTYRVGLRATHFGVQFLDRSDMALAERFGTLSGEDTDKFDGLDVEVGEHGTPLLRACANRMVLKRTALLDDGGDHVCITTKVLSAQAGGDLEPLRVSSAAHLEPGHASEERAISP
ncbi:flavin reductase (DIM6/NTAB) family NADH-FMN oxidoreductase RutF [Nocardioides daedukensis]|uniref:Flavin reductase (DIM6/NTAB) family NADH-FMN oxidoreductase RutF n=1 Tax=Nocardioides daedukensis TaxID=634462 RepID=A0A7Y9UT31_9ACTN|nr:flavin reductase [Nocardioides daedukensis]NYG57149.1 flavin reductase (DIM6/NTAB) family NADH-FMN oxidoreductase RutF [Nocardioides daedukensis]